MYTIIAAILLPVPLFHLWLHALLSFWKKRPWMFFIYAIGLWTASIITLPLLDPITPQLYNPTQNFIWTGRILMIIGTIFILSSLYSLGLRRFSTWAVLKPDSIANIKIKSGFFRFMPHPAYTGYIIVSLGNFLTSGNLLTASIFFFSLTVFPLVILLEEAELNKRVS